MIPHEIFKKIRQIERRAKCIVGGGAFAIAFPVCAILLCSCATERRSAPSVAGKELPPEVALSHEAGRGDMIAIPVRMEGGEELLVALDTGSSGSCFDLSLESKLGKPIGKANATHWGKVTEYKMYSMPALYLGNVRLQSGRETVLLDMSGMLSVSDRHIVGILGMDVLRHYCIQFDFAANKLRFLNPSQADVASWGRTFPIVDLNTNDWRPSVAGNLLGDQGPHALIDSGYISADGWLMPGSYQAWTNQVGENSDRARSPDGKFFGEAYPKIKLDKQNVESDGIGLSFLARHLVTLDFPGRTLYLKRVSVGPLPKPVTTAALDYLTTLKEQGKLPGWSKDDRGTPRALLSGARDIVTVKLSKNGAHDIYHFQVLMRPGAGPGRLQKAWRTTETGQMLEEYSIP